MACRYDGSTKPSADLAGLMASGPWVPFCPEQLGGLPTPRAPARIEGGAGAEVLDGRARVVNAEGLDVTSQFLRGARETAELCRRLGIRSVVLKARSPSCGVGAISNGSELVAGDGVTAALLKTVGIAVHELGE